MENLQNQQGSQPQNSAQQPENVTVGPISTGVEEKAADQRNAWEQGYIPATPPKKPKIVYTKLQRWRLLSALAAGVAWSLFIVEPPSIWDGYYGLFWLVAMGAFTPFFLRRLQKNPTAIALGIASILLCGIWIFHQGLVGPMYPMMLLATPAVMLLYLAFGVNDVPLQQEGVAAKEAIRQVFVYPFSGSPRFFGALGAVFRGRSQSSRGWQRWGVGIAVSLPLFWLVSTLLSQADGNMSRIFRQILTGFDFGSWLHCGLWAILLAMLFDGLFYQAMYREKKPLTPQPAGSWPASTLCIIVLPLLAVYALYVCLQFSYLFSGVLPNESTYSEYAREGFAQLNVVAAINFTLFGLTLRYGESQRILQVLSGLLMAATGLIVASCIVRLCMYIGAYGLTILRILPMWLAIFLGVMTVLCLVRLWKKQLPVLRIGGLLFVYWYVLLNVPNWAGIIAQWNG